MNSYITRSVSGVCRNAKDYKEVDDGLSSNNADDDDVLPSKFVQYVARVLLDFVE